MVAPRHQREVILPAQVIALQQATLYAKVSGYLKTITVDKGDKVAAGARPLEKNAFKIELAKRCLTHALQLATA